MIKPADIATREVLLQTFNKNFGFCGPNFLSCSIDDDLLTGSNVTLILLI